MNFRLFLLVGAFLIGSFGFAQDYGSVNPQAIDTALFQVLADPSKYHKKSIRVFGIYYWSHDGSYLFLTRDHYDAFDTASALELAVGEKYLPTSKDGLTKLVGRPVILEGELMATEGVREGPLLAKVTRIMTRGSSVSEKKK